MARAKRDPRTKEEFLDRILRFDFDGDVRNIGAEPATIVRTGANSLLLTFPATGTTFELSIHRPREFSKAAESRSFQPVGGAKLEPVEAAPEPQAKPKRKYTRRKQEERREA